MGRGRAARSRRGLTAFIDDGSELEGKYSFTGTVMLNGRFQGELSTPDTLIVGERGVVHGTIRAGTVVINGECTGTVQAAERLELAGRARVAGDLEAPVVVIAEGVVFDGHCRMSRPGPAEGARELSVVPLRR